MKNSTKIKILAMESCFLSDIPAKTKKKHLEYIKEKADPYQCIGYILDGKFYTLNESGKQELKKRFLKEQSRLSVRRKSAMSATAGVFLLPFAQMYRMIRASFSKCTRACGVLSMNTAKRQYCMISCKVKSLEQEIDSFQKLIESCERTSKPEKCKEKLEEKINKAKVKLEKAIKSQNKMKVIMARRKIETTRGDTVNPNDTQLY